MSGRFSYRKASPEVARVMMGLENYVNECGLEPTLLDLVRLRASQINGCAFCIDMHWKDLRARGEEEQRLYMLIAWRESTLYSERERAALAWAEALTLVADEQVPDALFEETRQHFSDKELADLTLAVVAINGWNRLNVAFRTPAGRYQPRQGETR
jgi:AhpD family alkylhydroperoxidase